MNQKNNPQTQLEGITLKSIVTELVDEYGFERLGEIVNIRCFKFDASIKSCLTFLRKTPWARKKVELLYMQKILKIGQNNH